VEASSKLPTQRIYIPILSGVPTHLTSELDHRITSA
jgi:hypothetical protein